MSAVSHIGGVTPSVIAPGGTSVELLQRGQVQARGITTHLEAVN